MPQIDDYPTLAAALGKAGCDRIRMHTMNHNTIGGARTRWVQNPHRDSLLEYLDRDMPPAIEDIFIGVVRSEQNSSKPLNAMRLFTLLAFQNRLSTDSIEYALNIDARQARRYMAAARLAIYLLTRKLSASALIKRSPTLAEVRAAQKLP